MRQYFAVHVIHEGFVRIDSDKKSRTVATMTTLQVRMTINERFISKIRFSSSSHCHSPMCVFRWYEIVADRCRPAVARCIWMTDGYIYMCSKDDPRQFSTRFIICSIRSQVLPLADHPKKVIVLASGDKSTHKSNHFTITYRFKSQSDAIEWRIILQKSKADSEKRQESEQQRLEIIELYLQD